MKRHKTAHDRETGRDIAHALGGGTLPRDKKLAASISAVGSIEDRVDPEKQKIKLGLWDKYHALAACYAVAIAEGRTPDEWLHIDVELRKCFPRWMRWVAVDMMKAEAWAIVKKAKAANKKRRGR